MESFVGEYKIDDKICDDLIHLFESNPHEHTRGGTLSDDGAGGQKFDESIKKSTDMGVRNHTNNILVARYMSSLQECLVQYMDKYPEVDSMPKFRPTYFHMQRYDNTGHYMKWHYERTSDTYNRCLAYLTYLNDVPNGGETEFKYLGLRFKPEKGKTIIFPADWTHTHRGNRPIGTNTLKYIATGWYLSDMNDLRMIN